MSILRANGKVSTESDQHEQGDISCVKPAGYSRPESEKIQYSVLISDYELEATNSSGHSTMLLRKSLTATVLFIV